jgi:hypothetical protein
MGLYEILYIVVSVISLGSFLILHYLYEVSKNNVAKIVFPLWLYLIYLLAMLIPFLNLALSIVVFFALLMCASDDDVEWRPRGVIKIIADILSKEF